MPRSKAAEAKEQVEEQKEETPTMPEIPSLTSVLAAAKPDESEEEEVANVADVTMKYLMRKEREKTKLVQETLRILPELAQSDNPLTAIMLEKVLTGSGGTSSDELAELKELAKAMSYTVILPELMKDVAKTIRGSSDQENMMAILMQILEERDRRLQELIEQIKEDKEAKAVNELRQEFYDAMNTLVETFSKSLQEIQMQIASMQQAQPVQTDPLAQLEQLEQMIERSKTLLEKLGYKVAEANELTPEMLQGLDAEKEIKLKELELKEKELEAKNQLYNQIGQALTTLLSNPDNIFKLISGLTSLFRAGPMPNAPPANPGAVKNVISSGPSKVPSLSSYLSKGGGDSGGAGADEGSS